MLSVLHSHYFRALIIIIAFCIMACAYVFLQTNSLNDCNDLHPTLVFVLSKTIRLVVNDVACMLLIWAIFLQKKHLRVAWYLFAFELIIILPLYFAVKLTLEGPSEISSPLFSHIHRLIVNPVLMLLLITGFFYQKIKG